MFDVSMKLSIYGLLAIVVVASIGYSQIPSRFDQWDKDKSGTLTKEELPKALQKNFEKVDRDKNGSISREEDAAIRKRGKGKRENGGGEVAGVKRIPDLDYSGNENPRQMLDLYLPEAASKDGAKLPLVCWIHGGGWQNGAKDRARFIEDLVKSGKFAGASIGYRLTDEAQWPSQIHDCKAAIRWLKANADKYGYDAEKIAVWGSSAGGHLVAMLGVAHDIENLEGTLGEHLDQTSEVACVVDYYGPAELLKMNEQGSSMDHDAAKSPESKLVGGPQQETRDVAKDASPITHVTKDDEPILIVHGTKDPLVPYQQSVEFKKNLDAAGVPAIFVTVEDAGHGKGFPPEISKIAEQFITHHLLGEGDLPKDQTVKSVELKTR